MLYTGRTVRAALDECADFGRPRRILLCVLIDRGGRELPIQADIVGQHGRPPARGDRVDVLVSELDGARRGRARAGEAERDGASLGKDLVGLEDLLSASRSSSSSTPPSRSRK